MAGFGDYVGKGEDSELKVLQAWGHLKITKYARTGLCLAPQLTHSGRRLYLPTPISLTSDAVMRKVFLSNLQVNPCR